MLQSGIFLLPSLSQAPAVLSVVFPPLPLVQLPDHDPTFSQSQREIQGYHLKQLV